MNIVKSKQDAFDTQASPMARFQRLWISYPGSVVQHADRIYPISKEWISKRTIFRRIMNFRDCHQPEFRSLTRLRAYSKDDKKNR